MHEYHGAVQIIEHAQDLCRERKHNQVNKIQLVIGAASGYTFEVVEEYFKDAAKGTVCEGAELTVRTADVMLRCPNCNELFVKKLLQYNCPICNTPGNPTEAGKEMAIESMESEWNEAKGDVLAREIKKEDVVDFFNTLAPSWDADQVRNEKKMNAILDFAGVKEGISVLDVACGTGVMIPEYLDRKVAKITGVDISSEMIRIAREKFAGEKNIEFICADVEEIELEEQYDICMVYNAFPHFPNPAGLIQSLSEKIKKGGRLTVAHGMSRKQLDSHHSGAAQKVSMGLMHEDDLEKIFGAFLDVDVKVSNDEMYVVSGVKR